jgi:plastocyanin
MFLRRLVLGSAVLLVAASCSSTKSSSTTGSTGNAISAKDFAFSPNTLKVKAGTTVVFTNNDTTTHTFSANDGSFDAGRKSPGQTFSFTVPSNTKAGTVIAYHCNIHHSMTGEIDVQA